MNNFDLLSELCGHDGAVRAIAELNGVICTGAMDSVVKRWRVDEVHGAYNDAKGDNFEHEHWITSILAIPPNILELSPRGGFITGCMDKLIRIFNDEFQLIATLCGHEAGVISLKFASNGNLLSGSWDGTARVWDMNSFTCIQTLRGHENGVCVLGLPNGDIVTGSTGKQEGNTVIDFQLRIWNVNHTLSHVVKDHRGPVRQLVLLPDIGFASCSNDGTIKIRSYDGQVVQTFDHATVSISSSTSKFLLGLAVLKDGEIVSASDDCFIYIWSPDGKLLQTIEHPGGLWCVSALGNGDFVTGCEDKTARVFTKNKAIVSKASVDIFNQKVKDARLIKQRGPDGVDIEKLPQYENRSQIRAKSDGGIQMFNKNGQAWACQWSAPSSTWLDIGEVTGTGSGGVIDNESFDMVIPVEIEIPGSRDIQKLQIGYNQNQNPFQVAQEFINKHHLDQSYLKQIADYITQRSSEYRAPVIGTNEDFANAFTPPDNAPTYQYFPASVYQTFDSMKITKLMSTLIQFNETFTGTDKALSAYDIEQLHSIVKTIQRTAYYHSSHFQVQEIQVLLRILQVWPAKCIFPVLDLIRLVVLHPHGAQELGTEKYGTIIVQKTIEFATLASTNVEDCPVVCRMLSLRILCNLFVSPHTKSQVLANKGRLFNAVPNCVPFVKNKVMVTSFITLIFNLAIALLQVNETNTANITIIINACVQVLTLETMNMDIDATLKLLVTMGTLCMLKKDVVKPLLPTRDAMERMIQPFQNPILNTCMQEYIQIVYN